MNCVFVSIQSETFSIFVELGQNCAVQVAENVA